MRGLRATPMELLSLAHDNTTTTVRYQTPFLPFCVFWLTPGKVRRCEGAAVCKPSNSPRVACAQGSAEASAVRLQDAAGAASKPPPAPWMALRLARPRFCGFGCPNMCKNLSGTKRNQGGTKSQIVGFVLARARFRRCFVFAHSGRNQAEPSGTKAEPT